MEARWKQQVNGGWHTANGNSYSKDVESSILVNPGDFMTHVGKVFWFRKGEIFDSSERVAFAAGENPREETFPRALHSRKGILRRTIERELRIAHENGETEEAFETTSVQNDATQRMINR